MPWNFAAKPVPFGSFTFPLTDADYKKLHIYSIEALYNLPQPNPHLYSKKTDHLVQSLWRKELSRQIVAHVTSNYDVCELCIASASASDTLVLILIEDNRIWEKSSALTFINATLAIDKERIAVFECHSSNVGTESKSRPLTLRRNELMRYITNVMVLDLKLLEEVRTYCHYSIARPNVSIPLFSTDCVPADIIIDPTTELRMVVPLLLQRGNLKLMRVPVISNALLLDNDSRIQLMQFTDRLLDEYFNSGPTSDEPGLQDPASVPDYIDADTDAKMSKKRVKMLAGIEKSKNAENYSLICNVVVPNKPTAVELSHLKLTDGDFSQWLVTHIGTSEGLIVGRASCIHPRINNGLGFVELAHIGKLANRKGANGIKDWEALETGDLLTLDCHVGSRYVLDHAFKTKEEL